MIVRVEAAHIERGRLQSRFGNPIALAVAEQFAQIFQIMKWETVTGFWIETDSRSVVWETKDTVYEWFLPEAARKFLADFNRGRPVKPVSFDLTK